MEQIYSQNQSRQEERGLLYLPHYILKLIFLNYLFWYHWCSVTLKIGGKTFPWNAVNTSVPTQKKSLLNDNYKNLKTYCIEQFTAHGF